MIRLLIWGVVIYLLYRFVRLFLPAKSGGADVRGGGPPAQRPEKKDKNISDANFTDLE
jgi:hypothetical protein